MAVSFKTALGTGLATSSGTTIVVTTTAAIAIGDLVVVRWAADNLNATTPTATCADGGNTYGVLRQAAVNATAAAGVAGGMLATKATVARASGSTITVTLSGAVAHKCATAESFVGAENTTRVAAVGATGTATAASAGATAAGILAGDLVLGHIANETRGTITGDTDTTNGAWSTQVKHQSATSGSDATCVSVAGQYKIATAGGAQTYNVTAVGAEWVCQCVVLQATPEATITQAAYGFYDDTGTESGAAALAAANTAITGDIVNGDGFGALRIRVQSTNAGFLQASDDYQLQWEKNASGSWTNVALTGNTVLAWDNPNLTGTGPTTNRLGAGTGSFAAGEVCEDGAVNDLALTANNYTEILYSLKILAADVVAGDTLRFRILRNGATTGVTYTQTPTINIIRSAANITATISSNWGGWTSIATAGLEHPATGAGSWGTWTAAASGTVTSAAVEWQGTISTSWGTWTATATGAPDRAATGASDWGTWSASAVASPIQRNATTITNWGTWVATAEVLFIERYGTITSSWSTWTATSTATVFTPAAWAIPQNVLATTTGITTITVTWDDVPAATGYDVERNGTVIVYDHPDSPYNDSGLNPDTVYSYRVRAVG